jgi:hypothetical protein
VSRYDDLRAMREAGFRKPLSPGQAWVAAVAAPAQCKQCTVLRKRIAELELALANANAANRLTETVVSKPETAKTDRKAYMRELMRKKRAAAKAKRAAKGVTPPVA